MGILLTISQVGNLITSFLVPSIEAAIRIRSLFDLDPSYTVNMYSLTGSALTADDAVLAAVNQWRVSKGLPPYADEIPPLATGTAIAMPVMIIPQPATPADAKPPAE